MEEPAANNNSRHWPSSIEPSSSRPTRNGCTIPLNLEIETTESLTAVAGHVCVAYRGCLICWGGYCYDEREIHYRECNWLYIFPYMLCGAQNNVWLKVQCETDLQLRPNSGATAAVWRDQLFIFGGCLFDEIHKRMVNTSMLLAIDLRTGVLAAKNYPPDERIPTPRDKTTSWIANNKFYVFGGYGMSWHRLDHSKHKYFFQPQSFLDDDMGSCWNNQLLFYDIRKECWSEVDQRGKKPSQRAAAASIFVADLNRAFLFGGRHDQNRLNDLYMLDMVSMIWTQIDHSCHTPTPPNSPAQNLPEGRSWCTMTLLAAEKKILCYGGLCSRGQPLSDLWELDISKFYAQQQQQPTEHSKVVEVLERPHWKQVPPLDHQLPPRLWHCAVLMGSEAILLYGGMNEPPSRDSPFVRTLLVQRLQPPSLGQLTLCQLAEGIVDRWMAQMNSEKASANSSSGYRLQLPSAVQAMDNGHLDLQCFASAAGFMAGLPKSLHPHLRMLLSICKHAKALNPAGGNTPRGTSPSRRWQSLPAAPLNFHNFHLLNLDGMVDGGGDSEDEENYQVDRHHLRLGRRSHWNVPLSPKSQKRALADEIVKQVCENGRARSIPFMQALFNAFDAFC